MLSNRFCLQRRISIQLISLLHLSGVFFFISIHKHVSWKQPSYHFTVIQPTLLYISASDNLHAVPKNMVMYSECVVKCIRRKAKLFYMPLHCCVYSDNEIYGLCELKDGKSIPVHVL